MKCKALFLSIAVCLLTLSGASVAQAQPRIIRQPQFYDATRGLAEAKGPRSRVETMVDETLKDGFVVKTVETLLQVLKPDRSRHVVRSTENGVTTETETIEIGFLRYSRKDGEGWTKVDMRRQLGVGNGIGIGGNRSCEQFTVEDTFVAGSAARLFEKTSVESSQNELKMRRERYWVGLDGLPYREEVTEGRMFPPEDTFRRTVTYEYDPQIKIEAPIP